MNELMAPYNVSSSEANSRLAPANEFMFDPLQLMLRMEDANVALANAAVVVIWESLFFRDCAVR